MRHGLELSYHVDLIAGVLVDSIKVSALVKTGAMLSVVSWEEAITLGPNI